MKLSDRQNEILELLATGKRHKEIADKLGISVATVQTHVLRIRFNLSVGTVNEALILFATLRPRKPVRQSQSSKK